MHFVSFLSGVSRCKYAFAYRTQICTTIYNIDHPISGGKQVQLEQQGAKVQEELKVDSWLTALM